MLSILSANNKGFQQTALILLSKIRHLHNILSCICTKKVMDLPDKFSFLCQEQVAQYSLMFCVSRCAGGAVLHRLSGRWLQHAAYSQDAVHDQTHRTTPQVTAAMAVTDGNRCKSSHPQDTDPTSGVHSHLDFVCKNKGFV